MTEDDARAFLLVRAVELQDGAEAVLTRDDRREATAAALAGGPAGDDAFLARRAEVLEERLLARFPAVRRATAAARWPGWLDWALPLAALALGAATSEIGGGKRLNIIAFPLLGMLAWNLTVYLSLGLGALRRAGGRGQGGNGFARLLGRWAEPLGRKLDAQQALGRALRRFAGDWLSATAALTYSRASRALHLSAAALAVGALLGMYLRALGVEYRAGWESTFVGAETLRGVLAVALGPASALTGVALPDAAGLERLRWSEGPGANAGPWIHLYAATAFLLIIGPRLVLAAWHAARAGRVRRTLPVGRADDGYARRLLRSASGEGAAVRVLPYSFRLPDRAADRLRQALGDALGAGTRTELEPSVAYGAEDERLATDGAGLGEADHLLALFNLSATPEAENQGAFVAGLRRLGEPRGAGVAALVDEAAFRRRLAGGDARLQARRAAWGTVLRPHGVEPVFVDLEEDEPAALVRALEDGLLRRPTATAA